jgi:hypothetical protein
MELRFASRVRGSEQSVENRNAKQRGTVNRDSPAE